jgi:hypothetical protein
MSASTTINVHRGNDTPVVWRFKNADKTVFDLSGSDFILRVKYQETTLTVSSASNTAGLQVNGALGQVTWNPSAQDTLRLKAGRPSPYELDRVIDDRTRTLVTGDLVGHGVIDG